MQFALLDDLCIPAISNCEKLGLRVKYFWVRQLRRLFPEIFEIPILVASLYIIVTSIDLAKELRVLMHETHSLFLHSFITVLSVIK